MNDELWIIVPNWDRFQHYSDRNPAWIKLYLELAHRDDWRRLTFTERGLLVSIWAEYALSRGQLRLADVPGRVRLRSLNPLLEAGWLALSASKPPARAPARSREVLPSEEQDAREAAPVRAAGSRAKEEKKPRRLNAQPTPAGAASYVRNVGHQDPNLERTLRETFHVPDDMLADLLAQVDQP